MNRRDYEKMIETELASFGITDYKFSHRGEHPVCYFTFKDGSGSYVTYPGTPGDERGLLNRRSELRRLLRGFGCQKKT